MKHLNETNLLGHLGDKPELRFTQAGVPFAKFSMATTDAFTDDKGNTQHSTDWHKVAVWGKQAQNAADYLVKGSKVLVKGKVKNNHWEKDGVVHRDYEIKAFDIFYLDSKNSKSNSNSNDDSINNSEDASNSQPVDNNNLA